MHAGLPMAHPMGAHFEELVGIIDLGFGRWRMQGKASTGMYRRDRAPALNEGGDLNKPDVAAPALDGPLEQRLFCLDVNGSYLFNPVSNLRASVGFTRRDLTPGAATQQSSLYYITVGTNLFNRYYDL
jgi:hypothetical protein